MIAFARLPMSSRPSASASRVIVRSRTLWRSLVVPLAIALPPLYWVARGHRARVARRRWGATRASSSTSRGRSRGATVDYRDVRDVNGPAHAPRPPRLPRARRRRRAPLPRASTWRHRRGVRRDGRVLAGLCARAARRRCLERAAWAARGVGHAERAVPALRATGTSRSARASSTGSCCRAWRCSSSRRRRGARDRRRGSPVGRRGCSRCRRAERRALVRQADVRALHAAAARRARARPRSSCREGKAPAFFALGGARRRGDAARAALVWYGDMRAFVHDPARRRAGDVPVHLAALGRRHLLGAVARDAGHLRDRAARSSLLALVVGGEMPPRAIAAVALLPIAALVSVVVAGQGLSVPLSPRHRAACTSSGSSSRRGSPSERGSAQAAGSRWCAWRPSRSAPSCAHARRDGDAGLAAHPRHMARSGARAPPRSARRAEYFAHFPRPDFFPFELRQAAAYLREHTRPLDRVQTYGMDPYLLFLARRLSAPRPTSTRTT